MQRCRPWYGDHGSTARDSVSWYRDSKAWSRDFEAPSPDPMTEPGYRDRDPETRRRSPGTSVRSPRTAVETPACQPWSRGGDSESRDHEAKSGDRGSTPRSSESESPDSGTTARHRSHCPVIQDGVTLLCSRVRRLRSEVPGHRHRVSPSKERIRVRSTPSADSSGGKESEGGNGKGWVMEEL
jgi:hypothetical protein